MIDFSSNIIRVICGWKMGLRRRYRITNIVNLDYLSK